MDCLKKEKCIRTYDDNILWCNNRGITGQRYYSLILTFLIISIPYILLISIVIKAKDNLPIIYPLFISSIFYIVEILSMFIAACTDPGIMHRQEADFLYRPNKYTIKSIINGHILELKYCVSCNLYKPPRTSHCALCNNCIERFDHHCKWLGHCIGQRNYGSFYILILSIFLSTFFYIIYCLYYIIYQAKKFKNKENYNKIILWGLCAVGIYNVILLLSFIGKLFLLHTYLQFINKTFYEYLKKKLSYIPGQNPFKKYILYICKRLVLRCPGKSFYLYFIKHPNRLRLLTQEDESSIKMQISLRDKYNKLEFNKENDDNSEKDLKCQISEKMENNISPLPKINQGNIANSNEVPKTQDSNRYNNIIINDTDMKNRNIINNDNSNINNNKEKKDITINLDDNSYFKNNKVNICNYNEYNNNNTKEEGDMAF